jgi:hypothetical protein
VAPGEQTATPPLLEPEDDPDEDALDELDADPDDDALDEPDDDPDADPDDDAPEPDVDPEDDPLEAESPLASSPLASIARSLPEWLSRLLVLTRSVHAAVPPSQQTRPTILAYAALGAGETPLLTASRYLAPAKAPHAR